MFLYVVQLSRRSVSDTNLCAFFPSKYIYAVRLARFGFEWLSPEGDATIASRPCPRAAITFVHLPVSVVARLVLRYYNRFSFFVVAPREIYTALSYVLGGRIWSPGFQVAGLLKAAPDVSRSRDASFSLENSSPLIIVFVLLICRMFGTHGLMTH